MKNSPGEKNKESLPNVLLASQNSNVLVDSQRAADAQLAAMVKTAPAVAGAITNNGKASLSSADITDGATTGVMSQGVKASVSKAVFDTGEVACQNQVMQTAHPYKDEQLSLKNLNSDFKTAISYFFIPDMNTVQSPRSGFSHAITLCQKMAAEEKAAQPAFPKELF